VQKLVMKFSVTYGRRSNLDLMFLEPLVALILNFVNKNL
jgi:hypothetical protein